ncbi:helix-turn-helix transcriptional regulator [Halomonas huangheensis]|uniref:HTH luxR-type domain-containing protein n=1 Tax=Halomonas huangheensis TaxID=1178482 RepID=W1NCW0_9GAMM|nr:helix-turn-helix transcriptional regulator [Halomonas huangheensis]ERL53308.1 hypothetical protein BJB45_20955 [Halomonas huangheensis]
MSEASPLGETQWLDIMAWHRDMAGLLARLEGDDFWLAMSRLLARHVAFNTWVVLIFHHDQPPTILAESDEDDGADESLFQDYQQGLYLLDPFYVAARDKAYTGLVTLDDVAPQCFTQTEYYQRYFKRNIVADEVQLNQPLDGQRTLCLSLGAVTSFDQTALGVLQLIQPWICELLRVRMHFEQPEAAPGAHPWHPRSGEVQDTASQFGLTDREREVSQLMLGGSSTKEIARRLDISVETVRAHKKHLYAKLSINSQAELFARFWQDRV